MDGRYLTLLFSVLSGLMVLAAICAAIGGIVGSGKDKGAEGALLGFLLGPLGVVLALAMRPRSEALREPCPDCGELVLATARRCPFCRARLDDPRPGRRRPPPPSDVN